MKNELSIQKKHFKVPPTKNKKVNVEGNWARDYVVSSMNKTFGKTVIVKSQWPSICKKFNVSGILSAQEFNSFVDKVKAFISDFYSKK